MAFFSQCKKNGIKFLWQPYFCLTCTFKTSYKKIEKQLKRFWKILDLYKSEIMLNSYTIWRHLTSFIWKRARAQQVRCASRHVGNLSKCNSHHVSAYTDTMVNLWPLVEMTWRHRMGQESNSYCCANLHARSLWIESNRKVYFDYRIPMHSNNNADL